MVTVQVLIPVADNNGEAFAPSEFDAFQVEVLRHFGGFSKLPGRVSGGWQDNGVVYADELIVYEIGVGGLLADAEKLAAVVAFAREAFRQEAIGVRYLGQFEVL